MVCTSPVLLRRGCLCPPFSPRLRRELACGSNTFAWSVVYCGDSDSPKQPLQSVRKTETLPYLFDYRCSFQPGVSWDCGVFVRLLIACGRHASCFTWYVLAVQCVETQIFNRRVLARFWAGDS